MTSRCIWTSGGRSNKPPPQAQVRLMDPEQGRGQQPGFDNPLIRRSLLDTPPSTLRILVKFDADKRHCLKTWQPLPREVYPTSWSW
jgi:hypothetical protein